MSHNGLGSNSELVLGTDPATGLPVVEVGRRIASEDVATMLEDG